MRLERLPGGDLVEQGLSDLAQGRESTIDVDLKLVPDHDELLRAIAELKEPLEVNLELAAPDDFIPPLPGWQERSLFVDQIGTLAIFHYDPYTQALAKVERFLDG